MALKQLHTDEISGKELDPSKRPYVRVTIQVNRVNYDESFPPVAGSQLPHVQQLRAVTGDYESLTVVNKHLKEMGLNVVDDKNDNPVPGGSGPEKPAGAEPIPEKVSPKVSTPKPKTP